MQELEEDTAGGHEEKARPSKRGILWLLTGLVAFGATAIYRWWRSLPR